MSIGSTLRKLSPPLYRVQVVAATVLLLAIPLLTYYLFYVRNQSAYFTERSFRSLSLVGQQIALKVESAGTVLKNSTEQFVNPKDPGSPTKFDFIKSDKENLDGLLKSLRDLNSDSPQIIPFSLQRRAADGQELSSTTISGVSEDEGVLWLYLNYSSQPTADKQVVVVNARTDFRNLLQPLLALRENIGDAAGDQFQDLLIAEATNGKVFFQLDPSELRLASLDKLTTYDEQRKFEVKELAQASTLAEVKLAGSSFKAFFDPLELSLRPTGSTNANTLWIIAGLIRSESFRAEVWSVSYALLILCAFVTALLLLNWPFIKLVLIGPKDRLRTADIYFLTFSTIVVLAVLTSFGLYWYSYWKIGGQLDSQLSSLSVEVKANFNEELNAALRELQTLAANGDVLDRLKETKADAQNSKTNPGENHGSEDKNPERSKVCLDPVCGRHDILSDDSIKHGPYPFFDTAVWLDQTGMQNAKWTVQQSTTNYIDVSARPYFQNLRIQNSQSIELEKGKNPTEFSLQPIISKTTGLNEVEIAIHAPNDQKWITAFDTRLISLMQPVLPAGFGFLIIDKSGKVLFHSDEAHHLGENFIRECDDDPRLRSAVIGKNGIPLDVRYLGQDHSVLVTGIDHFPEWSLIVFRTKQTLRSAYLEMLSLVSLLFLLYSLILMTALTLFYLVNFKNQRRAWLWPSRKKTEVYYQSFSLLLILTMIAVPLVILLHGQWLIGITTFISFVGISIYFAHLRQGFSGLFARLFTLLLSRSNWFWRYEIAYVLNLAILLMLVAILPAAAFFKYAFHSEMALFIKHGQFTLASSIAKRNLRIRSQYADIQGADSSFVHQRIALKWDIYDKFFFKTEEPVDDGTPCPNESRPDRILAMTQLLPLSNQTSIERRGLLNPSSSECCRWETPAHGVLRLHLDNAAAKDLDETHLVTNIPPLGIPGFGWIVVFLLAFIPFFLWLHFIIRKVYLLDIHRPSSYPLKKLLQDESDRNLFIVLEAPFTERLTVTKPDVSLIDLQSVANAPDWADSVIDKNIQSFSAVAIDHFDYKLTDAKMNEQKIKLLEKLLEANRRVVVLSDFEPSLYQFGNGNSGADDDGHDGAGRWAGLMSMFFKEYAEDLGDSDEFIALLEAEKERLGKSDLKGEPPDNLGKLIDMLIAECDHKLPLQNIGRQILEQKNFVNLTPDHLLNRILSQARTYYMDIWNNCSPDERLTLFHLAQDRLLSHRDPDIQPLMRRGLIVRDSDIHLMNESFRQFVKSTEQVADVAHHEETVRRGSLWNTLKGPLLVILSAVAVFLFVTQRDLYTSSLGVLTAITTLIPALFKLLSLFQNEPPPRTSEKT